MITMIKTLDKIIHYNFSNKYYANEYGEVFFNKDTDKGNSKRFKHDKVKSFINKYGYVEYILSDINNDKKHIQAHRIVASLFITQSNKKQKYVNHIDGNKQNNHISNLEWCTATENEQHSYTILKKEIWNKGKTGYTQNKINTVYRFSNTGILEKEYNNPKEAEKDGYNLKQISACCKGSQRTHKTKQWSYNKKIINNPEPKRKTPGIEFRNDTKKWSSTITYKGKKTFLGCFSTKLEACKARNSYLDNNQDIPLQKINLNLIKESKQ